MRLRPARIEIAEVKARGVLHERHQPVPLFLLLGCLLGGTFVVGGHLHLDARGEELHRLHEVHVLVILHEPDDIPRRAAAEAVIVPVRRIDGKGGRLFVMKGTARPIIIAAPFKFYIASDDIRDGVLLFEHADEVLKRLFLHTLPSFGTNNFLKSPMA